MPSFLGIQSWELMVSSSSTCHGSYWHLASSQICHPFLLACQSSYSCHLSPPHLLFSFLHAFPLVLATCHEGSRRGRYFHGQRGPRTQHHPPHGTAVHTGTILLGACWAWRGLPPLPCILWEHSWTSTCSQRKQASGYAGNSNSHGRLSHGMSDNTGNWFSQDCSGTWIISVLRVL